MKNVLTPEPSGIKKPGKNHERNKKLRQKKREKKQQEKEAETGKDEKLKEEDRMEGVEAASLLDHPPSSLRGAVK